MAEQYKEADFWTLRQAELDFLSSLDQAWSKLAVTQRRKTVIRERLDAIRRENGMIEQLIGAGGSGFFLSAGSLPADETLPGTPNRDGNGIGCRRWNSSS